MAEVIQFNCPACGTLLRLPLAMAAQQGPCPSCDREIIAPDPGRGIGAHEAPAAAPMEVPAAPIREAEARQPVAPVQVPVCAKPQRAILVLSCLLSASVALASGFAFGVWSNRQFMKVPPVTAPVSPPPFVEKPAAIAEPPAPEPVPVKPVIETPEADKKPEPPAKVSAAAEAALRAFLAAPDWAARSAHVLSPEKARGAMEAYSHEAPDGPTAFKSVSVKQSYTDEKTGGTLFIFYVMTDMFPDGIPVAVKETAGGWRVDWPAFVEFRDNLFQKFVDGPANKTGSFHLIVTPPPPERTANTENEHFASFLLKSPLADPRQLAFVKKSSGVAATFQAAAESGGIFTPVLEVAKRQTAGGQSYFEVLEVTATDWLPREN